MKSIPRDFLRNLEGRGKSRGQRGPKFCWSADILFYYISLRLPEIGQNRISAGHWDQYILHYITLKAFAMASGDGTKCKTYFGGPRMILHAH